MPDEMDCSLPENRLNPNCIKEIFVNKDNKLDVRLKADAVITPGQRKCLGKSRGLVVDFDKPIKND